MKDWREIKIDTSKWEYLCHAVKDHENYNPACELIDYWKGRMTPQMIAEVKKTGKLAYGFVGDGFPRCNINQDYVIRNDKFNLRMAFPDSNWHCRDIGDSIFQANLLIDKLESSKEIKVADIGSGYGRLAIPFIYMFGKALNYFGIDYSPIGLLSASEFIPQVTCARVLKWSDNYPISNFMDYEFISLPAWRIKVLEGWKFNLFTSIHSMQEMTESTIQYYLKFINYHAAENALFYSINLPPADNLQLKGWKLELDEAYPINRDGSYRQKLYRKK